MTAPELVEYLIRSGATIAIDGDELVIDGTADVLTESVVTEIRRLKPALMPLVKVNWSDRLDKLLANVADPDVREHFVYLFNERAAIISIDGNLPRSEGERMAFAKVKAALKGVKP